MRKNFKITVYLTCFCFYLILRFSPKFTFVLFLSIWNPSRLSWSGLCHHPYLLSYVYHLPIHSLYVNDPVHFPPILLILQLFSFSLLNSVFLTWGPCFYGPTVIDRFNGLKASISIISVCMKTHVVLEWTAQIWVWF